MALNNESVKSTIDMALKVIRLYDWLIDLYVLDYFVDDHWSRLPKSWRDCFKNMDPRDLGRILLGIPTDNVLPLSFMSLLKCVEMLSLPREMQTAKLPEVRHSHPSQTGKDYTCASHPRLKNLFLKHVKLKKRHEISVMANVVTHVAYESNCKAVIDFGSGLGHLLRVLAYKNDIHTAGIECQRKLTEEARKLDEQLEYTAKKFLTDKTMSLLHRPIHLNMTLSSEDQLHHLPLPDAMTNFGLIGLHPCGDLGPLLLRNFINNPQVKFICVVGCCYMKLSEDKGYPMSRHVKGLNSRLSFVSREIACHSLDVYCQRLVDGSYRYLKIHAYRAALERILVATDPELKHAPVRSIKHSDEMTFERYASLALERVSIPLPLSPASLSLANKDLSQWRRVVALYTLRLALAPLIESVVLLDRVLYVLEHGEATSCSGRYRRNSNTTSDLGDREGSVILAVPHAWNMDSHARFGRRSTRLYRLEIISSLEEDCEKYC